MKRTSCFILFALCFASTLSAQQLVTEILDPRPFDFTDTVTIGYSFSTGSDAVLVDSLGFWDEGLDGFDSAVDVGLWDVDGNQLASITLGAGTSGDLDGEFRYEDLNMSVVLDPNSEYVLGAFRLPGVSYNAVGFTPGIDFLTDPNFTIIEERASSDAGGEFGIVFPGFVFDQGEALVGPNLRFSAVPEPGSTVLLGVFVLLSSLRRNKR